MVRCPARPSPLHTRVSESKASRKQGFCGGSLASEAEARWLAGGHSGDVKGQFGLGSGKDRAGLGEGAVGRRAPAWTAGQGGCTPVLEGGQEALTPAWAPTGGPASEEARPLSSLTRSENALSFRPTGTVPSEIGGHLRGATHRYLREWGPRRRGGGAGGAAGPVGGPSSHGIWDGDSSGTVHGTRRPGRTVPGQGATCIHRTAETATPRSLVSSRFITS